MRIRTRKNLKKKNLAIVFLFLLPIIGFAGYAALVLKIINDMASFTFKLDPPETDFFYDKEDINMTILAEMAQTFETRWELYHSPTNISVDSIFTDHNYDTVQEYVPTDNGGQWTGMMLAAECLRYKTAKNERDDDEKAHSIKLIRNMTTCFSNFLAAPNGGIGPDFPGIPARFVAAPNEKDIFPFMFEDEYIHFNGTGDYKNWRVRLSTSFDEMAGYIMGLGSVLKFVNPADGNTAKWCYERTRLLVAQLIEGFKKTNWLMITGDGTPCGTNLNAFFGSGGTWKLAFLKMGALAYPEKYTSDYNYIASKEMNINQAAEGSSWNVIMDYYALTNTVCLQYAMIILEDDPKLQLYYIKQYESVVYDICKYHRNAFVNIAHLTFMSLLDSKVRKQFENPKYDDNDVKWDVLDQLWRFHTSGWYPIRNYNLTQRPHSTRSTSLNSEIRKREIDPTPQKWRDYFENNIFGHLYSWVDIEFDFEDHYIVPVSVSEMGISSLVWESNPFYGDGGDPSGNGLKENTGMSYTIIYWMGRAFEIF